MVARRADAMWGVWDMIMGHVYKRGNGRLVDNDGLGYRYRGIESD